MPTHRTPEIQSKDEVKSKRTDESEQRMGLREEKAKAERVHRRVGRILSSRQYEASLH